MAALSDQLLVVTIFAYLLAMVCHAAEYAFGNQARTARAANHAVAAGAVTARTPVLATVGGPPGPSTTPATGPDSPTAVTGSDTPAAGLLAAVRSDPGRTALAGRAAVAVTVLGASVHLACLVTRGVAADRMPWGNMYEFELSTTFVGIVGWLVVLLRRPAVRRLGLFVALAMVLLLGSAGMIAYTPIEPLVPALNSYWFVIHVAAAIIASGLLLLGAVPAVMFLIRSGYDQGRRGFPYSLGQRVPAAEALERLTFRLHAFAFPIWTFGVAAGAIWAEAAWGRYWNWDPKETWAFISWVVYAGYLHARATPSVRRTTATWLAVLGLLTMLMNLFGVNLFFEGLHSYADVE